MAVSTAVYALSKPVVGGDTDVWGGQTNGNWDRLEAWFTNTFDSPNNNPSSGYLGNIKSARIPAIMTGARTIQNGSAPTFTVERTSVNNVVIAFKNNASNIIYAGMGVVDEWCVGVSPDLTSVDRRFGVSMATGNISWSGFATGDGQNVTNLNASFLASGTVPNARLPSVMSGKEFSSGISFGTAVAANENSVARHIDLYGGNWGFGVTSGQLNMIANAGGQFRFQIGNVYAGYISVGGIVHLGSSGFIGRGTSLTDLSATELTSGTVPNARMNGSYSFAALTLSGNIAVSGIATIDDHIRAHTRFAEALYTFNGDTNTGIGRAGTNMVAVYAAGIEKLRVTSAVVQARNGAVFSGDGSSLTDLNGTNVTTGIVAASRLPQPTDTAERTRICGHIADVSAGSVGTYAMLRNDTGATTNHNGNLAGSNLSYAHTSGTGGVSPSGTWKAMGYAEAGRVTLFLRIA